MSPQLVFFSSSSVAGGLTSFYWFHVPAISPRFRCRWVDVVFKVKPGHFISGKKSCRRFDHVFLFSHPWCFCISSFAGGLKFCGQPCIRNCGSWRAKRSGSNPEGVSMSSLNMTCVDRWCNRSKIANVFAVVGGARHLR